MFVHIKYTDVVSEWSRNITHTVWHTYTVQGEQEQ